MGDAERRARAAARRARASLHRTHLKPVEEDPSPLRGAEAISLVHRLTRESWTLSEGPEPDYPRDRIPVRFVPRRPK